MQTRPTPYGCQQKAGPAWPTQYGLFGSPAKSHTSVAHPVWPRLVITFSYPPFSHQNHHPRAGTNGNKIQKTTFHFRPTWSDPYWGGPPQCGSYWGGAPVRFKLFWLRSEHPRGMALTTRMAVATGKRSEHPRGMTLTTRMAVPTGKRSEHPRGMALTTRMAVPTGKRSEHQREMPLTTRMAALQADQRRETQWHPRV